MAEDDRLVVTDAVRIPRFELNETFSASGGPGGQHANKAATRVELVFHVDRSSAFRHESQRARVIERLGSPVRIVADDERSQVRNRSLAEQRLVDKLRGALRVERRRRPTKPTRGSQRRRLETKAQRSELKRQRRRPRPED
ncbi:alternative ribosome rescue aminoacyl-tRNA hydrolase ArfB [Ilumatobacter nonamiensis]|uniref:alternative ribosome rescue aminoacyl-tRNA hydrolase ArfB n=1 Tax=Ilumatobacter nonamiensis TaxID=467093 RepID=UPI001F4C8F37|nr:alternative ribosome rescue aminoacyl-tRNA hydrolase ArfB [Ilumatobacter nonamiensis]